MCTGARREYARTYYYHEWPEFLASVKAGPCADCGHTYPPVVMDFDHVPERGVKLRAIARMWSRSKEAIVAEIAKCDLVCANCHRLRTWARRHPVE